MKRNVLAKMVGVFLVMALAGGAVVQAQDALGFERAKHLRRGINLSMWYAQDPELYTADGGAAKLASFTDAADFKLVKEMGFDHVRLSIDPAPIVANAETGSLHKEAMARLDETVKQITALGLVVILDIHPETPWKNAATGTDEGEKRFLALWKSFAGHYAHSDPRQVYFEVLNEPEGRDNDGWAREQGQAIRVIRGEAPQHTIVATGADWGGIGGLTAIEAVPDGNIIYSFHDYHPMEFTHQGAGWSSKELVPLRGVPYPSSPEVIAPLLPGLKDEATRNALAQYGKERWNAASMEKEIAAVVAWAKARHVPLFCGEFGVYRDFAPAADRARWIGDMRRTLEKNGIGWNMWDYQGGFALVVKKDGVRTVDKGVAEALGLKSRE